MIKFYILLNIVAGTTRRILISLLVLIALVGVIVFVCTREQHGELIAKVNGYKIYQEDIQDRLNTLKNNYGLPATFNELPKEVKDSILLESGLNKEVEKLARKSGYASNPEIEKLTKIYKANLMKERFLNDTIYSKITEEQVRDEYDKVSKTLEGQEERQIKHILVETEADAQRIRKALQNGENFDVVASKKSLDKGSADMGGDIGYVLKSELDKDFGDIAFILKKGEISKPTKSQYGWHIIKVLDIRIAKPLSFEETKDNIKLALQQQALRDFIKSASKDIKIEVLAENKPVEITGEQITEYHKTHPGESDELK